MCSNYDPDFTIEEHRLQTFHRSDSYQTFKLLAQNGFVYDGDSSASCHSCGLSVNITQVNSDVVKTHRQGCQYGKKRGPDSANTVPGGASPEGSTHERNLASVQEEEASLRQQQQAHSNQDPNASAYPVVDLRAAEVHLAHETNTSSNPSDGTAEAPLAVGPAQVQQQNNEGNPDHTPAGVQVQEPYGTSQLSVL